MTYSRHIYDIPIEHGQYRLKPSQELSLMTSLHTTWTAKGYEFSTTLDGPVLFSLTYNPDQCPMRDKPWTLTETKNDITHWFKTREGAEFYALHLQAEIAGPTAAPPAG